MKIAVLLTTFNRKQKTLTCLESLHRQLLPAGTSLEIFLTDDASSDGTADLIKERFPCTHLYHGNGHLFWAGGMRYTWRQASCYKPDFYLLLNDDTVLHPDALSVLLNTSTYDGRSPVHSICIGSTCDDSGKLTYGGWKLGSHVFWKSRMVFSNTKKLECDFGNANIMLVPQEVVSRIGVLSEDFVHALADYDYTLKAKKSGFKIWVAPGFLGSCINDHRKSWRSQKVSFKERLAYLRSPKGLAYKEYLHFIGSHFPLSYPSAFFKLWMKTFFPFIWDRFKQIG